MPEPILSARRADQQTPAPSDGARMLEEFHGELGDRPGSAREHAGEVRLRSHLHAEEHVELQAELTALADRLDAGLVPDRELLEHLVRELADTIYITFGTARALGLDLDAALREVHRANMTKLFPPDGSPRRYRDDGKLLKPDCFTPPDMAPAVPPIE